jgi:hypothetical protein
MPFKVAFLAHAPEAEPEKHSCVVETSKFRLFSVLVRNQRQAVEVSRRLVRDEGIDSICLCPGFTHRDIAQISEAAGENVGVSVARGDGPSQRIAVEALRREGCLSEEENA